MFLQAGIIMAFCATTLLYSQKNSSYRFAEPELLYTDSRMTDLELAHGIGKRNGYNPFVDQTFWAIKRPNGKLRFNYQSMLHWSYHEGFIGSRTFFGNVVSSRLYFNEYTTSPKNRVRKRMTGVRWPANLKLPANHIPTDQAEGIPNIYAVSKNELLGLVHIERRPIGLLSDFKDPGHIMDRLYAIGIAWSTDTGATWIYCGDVVLPYWDSIDDTVTIWDKSVRTIFSNIGGIPYIITPDTVQGEMLTVYFNETPERNIFSYPAGARAPLDSVISYARRGRVNPDHWKKYASGVWSENSLHGLAGRILPPEPPGCLYDMHSDATYCTATGRYLITTNVADNSGYPDSGYCSLRLFSSADGMNWDLEAVLDRSCRHQPFYPSFISEFKGSTVDDHAVGEEFYILYARRPLTAGRVNDISTDLYAIHVNKPDTRPAK